MEAYMTKPKILLVAFVLIAFGATAIFAEQARVIDKRDTVKQDKTAKIEKAEKKEAIKVLKKTATVLTAAQKSVKRHKVYTGDLAKAFQHQQIAKELFTSGDYDRSIRQSLRARQLANLATKSNKGRPSEDFDRSESRYSKDMKADDLDRDAYKGKSSDKELKDEAIINQRVDNDFK
jgi:hypothetical protein